MPVRRDQLDDSLSHPAVRVPPADDPQLASRLHVFAQHPENLLNHPPESVLESFAVPARDLAARLLQIVDGRARRHVQAALAARELVLSAVLLHRVGHIAHHLVYLPVDRRGLHRLHHLADVVAFPLDDRLAHVGPRRRDSRRSPFG